MSDSEQSDVSWEEFFGTTTDLMPTLLGMYDALLDTNKNIPSDVPQKISSPQRTVSGVKKSFQSNNFTNLSPTVQKMLANIADQNENTEKVEDCSDEHSCKTSFKTSNVHRISRYVDGQKCLYSSTRRLSRYTEQKNSLSSHLNKSSECLSTICDNVTSNVQKMLSNIPDQDLVISSCMDTIKKVDSEVLHSYNDDSCGHKKQANDSCSSTELKQSSENTSFLYKMSSNSANKNSIREMEEAKIGDTVRRATSFNIQEVTHSAINRECNKLRTNKSLSPNLSTAHRFKSRTIPANFSQPHENPSNPEKDEKEVSRPVSLSSLGSCSSSGSSGPTQPNSMYLASTESLDSDPEPNGSQGSADSGIAEHPIMSPEQRVLQEVLDTENVYVTDLKQVVEGYLQEWRSASDCPLTPHLQDLFSNIEEIYEFNRKFLDELYEAGNDPTFVANAFIQNDAGFRIYTEYCTHYPRIMAILSELTRDNATARLIRERQTALSHALPLGSYLLKPVQRILKYHLLLQRLSKLCEQRQKPSIDLALQTMTSIAGHINHMKGKHEHAIRVQEVQSQLYGWTGADLTSMGELCAEGTFRVGGARGYRQVFLFDKVLLITKSKSDGALAYKFHIMCSNLMLVESVRGEPLSFHVIPFDNPRLQLTLRAKSLEHKREWTLQLKRVILENYNAVIPSHARQLVMQLGQDVNITNDSVPVDKWGLLKQHSTPQYLERRCRVRKSRDNSDRRATSHDRAFASLAAWRRKSEPNVAHYNTKTLPKKITKIKKAKERAKFYTDLSDSEMCDVISESNDSLAECKDEEAEESEAALASNTLEQVVSQLLMQNQEFQKILNRQRKVVKDENSGVWLKQTLVDKPKADSLPRSFQLNEDSNVIENEKNSELDEKLQECDTSLDTSEINEDDADLYPDHKIYRKSAIRFSLVQRFRAIISEEETKQINKLPTYKQGSELMGAKIAQPDYADPQKLFSSINSSQLNLDSTLSLNEKEKAENNKMSPNKQNKNVFETINLQTVKSYCLDTGQKYLKIKSPLADKKIFCDTNSFLNSSQTKTNNVQRNFMRTKSVLENRLECFKPENINSQCIKSSVNSIPACSDSYYEKILENSLNNDEKYKLCPDLKNTKNKEGTEHHYETIQNTKNISVCQNNSLSAVSKKDFKPINKSEKKDHTLHGSDNSNVTKKFVCSETVHSVLYKPNLSNSKFVKRPLKPPPPVPAKPARISQIDQNDNVPSTKGWVKTVVGRFE